MKFSFYEVDSQYIKFLKENADSKIPNINYDNHKKFFCGIVLTVNKLNYFVPVSSYKNKTHTTFLIYDKDRDGRQRAISSLRFSFMFPCPTKYLHKKDFSKEEEKYRILLRKELKYCNKNKIKIMKLAQNVYKLGIKEDTRNRFNICNFSKLEEKCIEYLKIK